MAYWLWRSPFLAGLIQLTFEKNVNENKVKQSEN